MAVMTLSEDAQKLWQTAQALALQARPVSPGAWQTRHPLPPLLYFTDPQRSPNPIESARHLPMGAGVVYRHFGSSEAYITAQGLREVTHNAGLYLLIGRDSQLAEQVQADGVHLPEVMMDQARHLRQQHPHWLITAAAHDDKAIDQAPAELDALIVSPVFRAGGASAIKPDLGLTRFTDMVMAAPCPVYGLGGIGAENAHSLIGTGACGLAGIEAIQAAFGR